jgi:hypothetical protein
MRLLWLVLVLLSTMVMGGCDVIGNIFQAGVTVGVIMVVVIIAGIVFLARKVRR